MENIESHFRELLDTSPDATVVLDDGGTILFANAQTSRLFDYDNDELLGAPVEMLLPKRLKETHGHRALYSRNPQTRPMGSGLELFGARRDGSEFPVEISLSPLTTTDGRLVSTSIRDITGRRMEEAALGNAKEDAERANAAKTRFLAAASHDLRQPLQSLSMYLDVLNRLGSSNPEKSTEVVQKMTKSIRAMGDLLDTLQDVSKLESGTIEPSPTRFLLQEVFDDLVVDSESFASERFLKLDIQPTDIIVNTDRALLLRILENLVSNAIRYTEQGSVTVSASVNLQNVQIDVIDTGIGIPESAIGKIFEEYTQLNNPARDRNKGLGLGLNLVKRISTLLNCRLTVHSKVGKGSIFSIVVPTNRVSLIYATSRQIEKQHEYG
jgi:PAS domain S-box-containing protein